MYILDSAILTFFMIMFLNFCFVLAALFGEGNSTPLQYSCLENPMDGGASWAAVHGVSKSRIRLSDFTFTFHFYPLEKEMATHSSVLAWRIPGTVEPGGLPSMGSYRVGHDWSDLAAPAGHHRAPNWAPCAIQQVPTSYLVSTWYCINVSAALSVQPTLPFPCCVHMPIL